MQKTNSRSKYNSLAQERLLKFIQGLGDIMVFETKRRKSELAEEGLDHLSDVLRSLLATYEKNPKRFVEFLYSKKWIDGVKAAKDNEEKLAWELQAVKYQIGLTTPFNQFTRVYESSIQANNEAVGHLVVDRLLRFLQEITRQQLEGNGKSREIFLLPVLATIHDISRVASRSMGFPIVDITYEWYFNTIFQYPDFTSSPFELSNVTLLNQTLKANLKDIITASQSGVLRDFMNYYVNVANERALTYSSSAAAFTAETWPVIFESSLTPEDLLKSRALTDKLELQEQKMVTTSDLNLWMESFEQLRSIFWKYADQVDLTGLEEDERNARTWAVDIFVFDKIVRTLFDIGAFSVSEGSSELIEVIWEHKPLEVSAVLADPAPSILSGVLDLYFGRRLFRFQPVAVREYRTVGDYYTLYLLMLLWRPLKSAELSPETIKATVAASLSRYPHNILVAVNSTTDRLESILTETKPGNRLSEVMNTLSRKGLIPKRSGRSKASEMRLFRSLLMALRNEVADRLREPER